MVDQKHRLNGVAKLRATLIEIVTRITLMSSDLKRCLTVTSFIKVTRSYR